MDILRKSLLRETPRSSQRDLGPSSVGGCKTQAWLQLQGQPVVNETDKLLAAIGTAIHAYIAEALQGQSDCQPEIRLQADGLRGTADLYSASERKITDWKSASVAKLSRSWPSKSNKQQVMLYGHMARKSGMLVEWVEVVGIPRDGTTNDIRAWTAPYDQAVADEGLAWLAEVKAAETRPEPSMDPARWCQPYCPFYDPSGFNGCEGKVKS